MASIRLKSTPEYRAFAALVSNETGAEFVDSGNEIVITRCPELVIPAKCFREALQGAGPAEWRALVLNRTGYLKQFNDAEIVIVDNPPTARPAFLYRFSNQDEKAEVEEWAGRLGVTLTTFFSGALQEYIAFWKRQAE